jgi:16S rRNA (guanine966-N2)-methyltransferase
MRIIAGERRGHRIEAPGNRATRPTSDQVREAIFNILNNSVEGRTVCDIFAGTGALGLEALSRGAARALFVENDRNNVALIRRNIGCLKYEDRSRVIVCDAYRWLSSGSLWGDEPHIVFVDPPYEDFQKREHRFTPALRRLIERLPAESCVVVESSDRLDQALLPPDFAWDVRRYGGTCVAFCFLSANAPSEIETKLVVPTDQSADQTTT